jgi:hypothetical protein
MTSTETTMPRRGERWRNKRSKRVAEIRAVIGDLAHGTVHYRYLVEAEGARFVQSPSVKLAAFLKAFTREESAG